MSRKKRPRRPKRRVGQGVYPSPAERERIIQRRDKLLEELITAVMMHPDDNRLVDKLVRRYGLQEVTLILNAVQKRSLSAQIIGEEAALYREYRQTFARFGDKRPFLSAREYEELSFEHTKLDIQRRIKSGILKRPSRRKRELKDLLLLGADFWEDITPPAVPPRPDDLDASPPDDYDYPVRTLLTWGWDLDPQRVANNAGNVAKWRPAVPDLVRMVLDEGLLNGWPGEPASWAPYHALHMLGHLRAHTAAARLLTLLDREDDWLSDRLPSVWAWMGLQAEPSLWDYVEDSQHTAEGRGIVYMGLAAIAEAHPERRLDVAARLARMLQRASANDAEANAYLVYVLNRLQAVEVADVISEAFEQEKIDLTIIQPHDVDFFEGW